MIIKTKSLKLRDYKKSDIDFIHNLVQEPDIYRYQIWGPNSLEDTTVFTNSCIANQSEEPRKSFEFCMTDIESNEILGAIGIRIQDDLAKIADMGYWVRKDYWGKGLATEAGKAILNFGFQNLELNRIWATASPLNPASTRVLEKIGMKKEGLLRSNLFVRGEYRDSVLLAILKNEFQIPTDPFTVINE